MPALMLPKPEKTGGIRIFSKSVARPFQLEALTEPACAEAHSTPETAPSGRYLAGPVDWEKPDQERVDALDLPIPIVNTGQASTLWAELTAVYDRQLDPELAGSKVRRQVCRLPGS